jgi:hypothetical protein
MLESHRKLKQQLFLIWPADKLHTAGYSVVAETERNHHRRHAKKIERRKRSHGFE